MKEIKEKMKKIASDLDNSLCLFPDYPKNLRRRFLKGKEWALKLKLYRKYRKEAKPNILLIKKLKNKKFYIVTSRKKYWKKMTNTWLQKYNLTPMAVFFYNEKEKTREKIIKYKANILKKLKIQVYYEDDIVIAEMLKKLCPKTKILPPPK